MKRFALCVFIVVGSISAVDDAESVSASNNAACIKLSEQVKVLRQRIDKARRVKRSCTCKAVGRYKNNRGLFDLKGGKATASSEPAAQAKAIKECIAANGRLPGMRLHKNRENVVCDPNGCSCTESYDYDQTLGELTRQVSLLSARQCTFREKGGSEFVGIGKTEVEASAEASKRCYEYFTGNTGLVSCQFKECHLVGGCEHSESAEQALDELAQRLIFLLTAHKCSIREANTGVEFVGSGKSRVEARAAASQLCSKHFSGKAHRCEFKECVENR